MTPIRVILSVAKNLYASTYALETVLKKVVAFMQSFHYLCI